MHVEYTARSDHALTQAPCFRHAVRRVLVGEHIEANVEEGTPYLMCPDCREEQEKTEEAEDGG